jgi:hypothetical protein
MVGLVLVAFTLIDGLVRNNAAPWAAYARGGLITLVFVALVLWAWRAGLRLPWPGALLAGILAAYTVAEASQLCCGRGISTWLVYAAVYGVQAVAKRDWLRDLSIAGIGLGALVLIAAPAGPAPGGALNRNMIAGALVVMAPAAWAYGSGRRRWVATVITVAALAVMGSRGAVVAGLAAAAAVYWRPWERLGRSWPWLAAPGYVALIGGLIVMRPFTFARRYQCTVEVISAWLSLAPAFGLGPGLELSLSWGELASNTHVAYLTPLAVAGGVGAFVIAVVCALLANRVHYSRWQLASLAAFAVHALAEENTAWWPVGIVMALVLVENIERIEYGQA